MEDSSVTVWGEGEPVVLIHASVAADPALVWPQQRPLAKHYQLLFPTRPGYGKRPVQPRSDVEEDIQEVSLLLEAKDGGHLVGLSYGGIVALGAAARNPAVVRSLTVLEPPAFAVARGNVAVEALVKQLKRPYTAGSMLTPEEFLRGELSAFSGQAPPEGFLLEPGMRKDVQAMMAEPPPWELEVPLDALATTSFPKLVVTGNWSPAFDAVAEVLTQRLHAQGSRNKLGTVLFAFSGYTYFCLFLRAAMPYFFITRFARFFPICKSFPVFDDPWYRLFHTRLQWHSLPFYLFGLVFFGRRAIRERDQVPLQHDFWRRGHWDDGAGSPVPPFLPLFVSQQPLYFFNISFCTVRFPMIFFKSSGDSPGAYPCAIAFCLGSRLSVKTSAAFVWNSFRKLWSIELEISYCFHTARLRGISLQAFQDHL